MQIQSLSLVNFRNFTKFDLNFDHDINIFLGNNAQGKTNLIESIYVLSVLRSFRTHQLDQLIQFQKEFTKLNARIISNNQFIDLNVVLTPKSKKAKVNLIDIKKTSDYVGYLNAVVFTPDDLNLVKGSPSVRRKFIDLELSKISPIYLFNLSKYNRLLKEKNKYLKSMNHMSKSNILFLEVLNEQMARIQTDIIKKRIEFISKLSNKAEYVYKVISKNNEKLEIKYKSFINLEKDDIFISICNVLKENLNKDIKYKSTVQGIQKEDLVIYLNQQNALNYASQGQQRTIVLAIKIALLELIKDEIGEYPILLLDDVLSELDSNRKSMLLSLLDQNIQTFITTTSINDIDQNILKKAKIFNIEKGQLKEE